jgi:DNA-binding beta-propeller fold protein YncE
MPACITFFRRGAGLAAAMAIAIAVGCAPSTRGAAGAPPRLLVLNAGDATLSRVQADGGRTAEPAETAAAAVPGPPGPWQLAPGPGGAAAVLSLTGRDAAGLTLVSRSDKGWATRPAALEAGAIVSHVAGDGRAIVAAYTVPGPAPAGTGGRSEQRCRLALVDPLRGVTGAAQSVCAPGEAVLSLAVAAGSRGQPVAYLGTWREAQPDPTAARGGPPGGRIVAVDATTGTVIGTVPVAAIAATLAVVPAQPGAGARLLCGCGFPDVDRLGRDDLREAVTQWQVVEWDAETLALAAVYPLPRRAHALAAAPDGGAAYALLGGTDVGTLASLLRLDLSGGAVQTLAVLTGRAAGLAVDAEHVYVPQLDGHAIWVVDRQRGRLVRTVPTAPRPIAIALASGA